MESIHELFLYVNIKGNPLKTKQFFCMIDLRSKNHIIALLLVWNIGQIFLNWFYTLLYIVSVFKLSLLYLVSQFCEYPGKKKGSVVTGRCTYGSREEWKAEVKDSMF